MNKFYLLLLLFTLHFSCKTPGKAYEKGNYAEAIELAIKKLQKNPDDSEARTILQNAYRFAVNKHEDEIRMLSGSNSEKRYEQIYQQYRALQNISENIRRYPTAAKLVNTVDYTEYINTYKDKAADLHYEDGVRLMQENSKPAYRQAYNAFKKASRLKPDDIELRKRMDEAYRLSVINVVIVPMDNYGGYMYSNSYQVRNFQDDLVRNLGYNIGNQFIKFHSEWNSRSMNIEPDEVIEMQFGNLTIGQPYDERRTREVSKEIIVKETVYKPDSIVQQRQRVYARVTTTRRTLVSRGDLFINIRDVRGRLLWSDNFRGEHRWQTEFATYTGDERALSDHDRSLLNRRDYAPQQDEIINELLRQIENDLAYRLRNYYSRYH